MLDIGLPTEICIVELDDKTTERIHVSSVGGGEYFVESIPYVTDKFSRCDLIAVEVRDQDTLYFKERLAASGHRTATINVDDLTIVAELDAFVQEHGLLAEQSDRFSLISIDLPVRFDDAALRTLLDRATAEQRISYTIR